MSEPKDYTNIYATYAREQAESMDLDDLVQAMEESIEARLSDLPEVEALEEIRDNAPHLLDDEES